jgi:hypothetical protein
VVLHATAETSLAVNTCLQAPTVQARGASRKRHAKSVRRFPTQGDSEDEELPTHHMTFLDARAQVMVWRRELTRSRQALSGPLLAQVRYIW